MSGFFGCLSIWAYDLGQKRLAKILQHYGENYLTYQDAWDSRVTWAPSHPTTLQALADILDKCIRFAKTDEGDTFWIKIFTMLKRGESTEEFLLLEGYDANINAEVTVADGCASGVDEPSSKSPKPEDFTGRAMKFGAAQKKPPITLINRQALEAEAEVLRYGAEKYARDNWRKGMPYSELLDGVLRHVIAFADGEDLDPETGINHLAHARCGLGFLLNYCSRPEIRYVFDDRHSTVDALVNG